jgi:hypothetical protein
VADPVINASGDEAMLLTYLQCDRPIRTEVSVRAVEEPKTDHETHHTGDERTGVKRIFSERERG